MTFRMKVEGVFLIGKRTVFAGELEADVTFIKVAACALEIDGERVSRFVIEGEVQAGRPGRDFWTAAEVNLDPETVRDRDVWLTSL